jgi:hypothetical protein
MRTIIPPAPARYLVTAVEAARRFAIAAYQAVCPNHGSELAAGRTGSRYVLAPVAVRRTAVRRNDETVRGW